MKKNYTYRTVIGDYQHTVENKIKYHKDESDFPKIDEYITNEELTDYLLDYQAAIDSQGTQRTRYTVLGIIICLPIIILSAFPQNILPLKGYKLFIAGFIVGVILAILYSIMQKCNINRKLEAINQNHPMAHKYVEKVINY